jgi:carboxypeptidase PM20D1
MKRTLIGLGAALLVLFLVLTVRALPVAREDTVKPAAVEALDSTRIAQHLSEAIRIKTITYDAAVTQNNQPFVEFREWLERTYPAAHAGLERERFAEHTLFFTWPGRNPQLEPVLLMGHMDVVPVVAGSETSWKQPPFSGAIAGGEVWGRGALDDKQHVVAILEAVEFLRAQNYQPERTVHLLFGHDEEGGGSGAAQVAKLLQARGLKLAFVLDEGGIIAEGVIPGVRKPVALIRTAEKGYLDLELSVRGTGGHSSAPPRPTPVGVLGRALAALEENPFPARLDGATRALLESTASHQSFGARLALRNLWLFGPLVKAQLARTPATEATIRTTIAPTMLQASPKPNVLPTIARATVNFRILPGETSDDVIRHVREAIDDERVELTARTSNEPSPVSDQRSSSFALIARTIREVAPDVTVAPFLLGAATDARHFTSLTPNVYGFSLARGGSELTERAHGSNERIAVRDVVTMVRFYIQLMRNLN